MAKRTLLLVDGHALAYRAYYAIPKLANSRGEPTGALYGFIKTLRKWLADHRPTHLAVAFDLGLPERLKAFPTYKSQRPPTPDDLAAQIPRIKDWLRASRIPLFEREGQEADDILATLAARAARDVTRVLIATNDKDLAQLVNDHILILSPAAKKNAPATITDADAVQSRFGVTPAQIVDYLALIGDASDNIPGLAGVGPKTAVTLLAKFGSLDAILQRVDKIENPTLRQKIADGAELLHRNRALLTLRRDVPLDVELEDLQIATPDYDRLLPILEQLESKSLVAEAREAAQNRQPTLL